MEAEAEAKQATAKYSNAEVNCFNGIEIGIGMEVEDVECDTHKWNRNNWLTLPLQSFHFANRLLYLYFAWDRSPNEIIAIVLRFQQTTHSIMQMDMFLVKFSYRNSLSIF